MYNNISSAFFYFDKAWDKWAMRPRFQQVGGALLTRVALACNELRQNGHWLAGTIARKTMTMAHALRGIQGGTELCCERITTPPFITNPTFFNSLTSRRGSP